MAFRFSCFVVLGLAPIAVAACAEPGPAAAQAAGPVVGIDLGSSSRIPQIAALAGRGEGLRGAPAAATPTDHGSMPGMARGSTGGMPTRSSPGMSKSAPDGPQMAQSGQGQAQGTGTVNSVDAASRKVNLSHAPISAIGWPAMTMDFPVAPTVDLRAVTPGTRINFTMQQGAGGMYVIQSIAPAGGGR